MIRRLVFCRMISFRAIAILFAGFLMLASASPGWGDTGRWGNPVDWGNSGIYERIVIRDDVGPTGARAFANPFSAVVGIGSSGSQFCTGVLVSPNTILSARHCSVFVGDDVVFGNDFNNPTFTTTVSSVFNPAGSGSLLDGGDISIVTLSQSIDPSIATPMLLTDETDSLVGELAILVGYGLNGIGSEGHQNSADGFRWAGTNIIDVYGSPAGGFSGSNIFSTDFDDPDDDGESNTIPGSSPDATEFEATTAPGDSGGPLLVRRNNQWVVAGILSGGTTSDSVYGDISWWTGIGPFRTDMELAGAMFVPEPSSGLLVAFGLGVLMLRHRGRRRT